MAASVPVYVRHIDQLHEEAGYLGVFETDDLESLIQVMRRWGTYTDSNADGADHEVVGQFASEDGRAFFDIMVGGLS